MPASSDRKCAIRTGRVHRSSSHTSATGSASIAGTRRRRHHARRRKTAILPPAGFALPSGGVCRLAPHGNLAEHEFLFAAHGGQGGHNPFKIIENISQIDAAKARGGLRIVTIGTHCAKQNVYDSLGKDKPLDDQPFPKGYSHHPSAYDESYFQGLTAETRIVTEAGAVEWHKTGRNEPLDTAVGNRAMYELCGGQRLSDAAWEALEQQRQQSAAPVVVPGQAPARIVEQREESRVARPSWMS